MEKTGQMAESREEESANRARVCSSGQQSVTFLVTLSVDCACEPGASRLRLCLGLGLTRRWRSAPNALKIVPFLASEAWQVSAANRRYPGCRLKPNKLPSRQPSRPKLCLRIPVEAYGASHFRSSGIDSSFGALMCGCWFGSTASVFVVQVLFLLRRDRSEA